MSTTIKSLGRRIVKGPQTLLREGSEKKGHRCLCTICRRASEWNQINVRNTLCSLSRRIQEIAWRVVVNCCTYYRKLHNIINMYVRILQSPVPHDAIFKSAILRIRTQESVMDLSTTHKSLCRLQVGNIYVYIYISEALQRWLYVLRVEPSDVKIARNRKN